MPRRDRRFCCLGNSRRRRGFILFSFQQNPDRVPELAPRRITRRNIRKVRCAFPLRSLRWLHLGKLALFCDYGEFLAPSYSGKANLWFVRGGRESSQSDVRAGNSALLRWPTVDPRAAVRLALRGGGLFVCGDTSAEASDPRPNCGLSGFKKIESLLTGPL